MFYSYFSRSSFSMEVRSNSSHGMLFYVSNDWETTFMVLLLSKGRFVFMFEIKGKKLRIATKEKYNDGLWHTVRIADSEIDLKKLLFPVLT